jgi:hypothetical protein
MQPLARLRTEAFAPRAWQAQTLSIAALAGLVFSPAFLINGTL